MLTGDAIKKHGNETIKVLVSEVHTRQNVEKYAKSHGKSVSVAKNGTEFELTIE